MARKKPFSGKQKKVQLQEKKEKQRASAIAYDQSQAQKAALQKQRARGQASDQDKPNETGQPQTIPAIGLPILVTTVAGDGAKSSQKSLAKAERYKLKFKLTTEVDIEEAKRKTCSVIADENADTLVLGFDELYYSTDDPVGFPVRPKWDYSMTKDQLEAREEAMFETWLSHVYTKHGTNVGHFEHNLETWRQLWRVLEVSDLILIVVDVRHPSLHFPPELYAYINKELQKAVVLVINKVDMAGLATQEAWVKYMQDLFPALTIVKLSSFPDIDQIADEGVYMKQYKRLNDIKKNDDMKQQILDSKCAIMQACANSCTRLPTQKEFIETYIQTLKDADAKQPNPNQSAPGDNSPNQSAPGDDKEDCLSDTGAISEDCESDDGLDTSTEGDDEMNGYSTQPTLRPYTTIGVVGQPNVGKSTLINTLFGRKVVSTSKTPGRTKHFQTIFISKTVRLCDCPGLIFPSYAKKELQILSGLYPISQVREPYTSVSYLASKIPLVSILDLDLTPDDDEWSSTKTAKKATANTHNAEKAAEDQERKAMKKKMPESVTAFDLCDAYARKRGFFTAKAGRPDSYRAANQLLRMTVEGRLIMAFKPPKFYHRDPRSPAPASDTQVPVQIQQHKDRTDTSTDTRTSTNAETSSDDIRADASVGDKVIESPNVQECIQEKQQGDTQQQTDSEEADDTTEESDSNDNAPPTRSRNAFSLLMDE